jgi:hypothetical protein
MTSQTKKFIELSDVVALRIQCGGCGLTVSVPISSFQSVPRSCSNCSTPFIGYESQSALNDTLNEMIAAFKKTQRLSEHYRFKFSFEISEPTPLASAFHKVQEQEDSK